jgi:hypothetical protein
MQQRFVPSDSERRKRIRFSRVSASSCDTGADRKKTLRRCNQLWELEGMLNESEKNAAAVALGRLGGLKGGKARAKALTPAARKRIAKRAAAARWKTKIGTKR